MRFLDLLLMSVNNLRRRKLRTALTVLGVIIGTASIVVMISLGIGFSQMTMERIASYGSLTAIEIYSNSWSGNNGKTEPNFMTDETMEIFKKMDHVKTVSPLLSTYVLMKQGVYEANVNLVGVTREYLEDIPLGEGNLPEINAEGLQMVVGNTVVQQFRNSKTGMGYWDNQEVPEIDFLKKPIFVIFDMDAYYQSQGGGETPTKSPKKYLVPTSGLVAGGIEDWNQYSYNVYTDIELLKAQLKTVFKKKAIPGQPTDKKGKPYRYFIYDQAVVYVDDMKNVTDVQKQINDMGYQANSNMEWLEQSKEQSDMAQAALGGIGAVSLFVAAIGIANTMMMSIYERTKEIGVMKVLGCDMGNIRNMFLLESGFIGFMGGIIGLVLSYGVSFLVNHFLAAKFMPDMPGDLSRIPMWLSGAAVVFSIFVGMAAGFFPAMRAMKLSPLAAIRND